MILMDGVHPEMDTCIIVEYKGTVRPLAAEQCPWGEDHSRRQLRPAFTFFLWSVPRVLRIRPLS